MKKFSLVCLMLTLCLCLCGCKSTDYENAVAQFDAGEYQQARDTFAALADYENSAEMVKKCDYNIAVGLMNAGQYGEAGELFLSLGEYEDCGEQVISCLCAMAKQYAENGKMQEAVSCLVDHYEEPKVKNLFCTILLNKLTDDYMPNVSAALDSWNEYMLIWLKAVQDASAKTAVGAYIDMPKVDASAPQVVALRRSMEKADKVIAEIREVYSDEVMAMCEEEIQALRTTVFASAETINKRFEDLDGLAVTILFYSLQEHNASKGYSDITNALYNIEDAVETVENLFK